MFDEYIGIDYSGAASPETGLSGLRAFAATADGPPRELRAPTSGRAPRHWSRSGLAAWLEGRLGEGQPALVGIDHAFGFPEAYFARHGLARDWNAFLDDFCRHWPSDAPGTRLAELRRDPGLPAARRGGDPRWRRLCDRRAGAAKSPFHFDVPGQVAAASHAGLPWLRRLRRALGRRLFVWPFDGWRPPAGVSVLAEAYPRLYRPDFPRPGLTPDQQDAYAVAAWLAREAAEARLQAAFTPDLTAAERHQAGYEGWILGVG